MSDGEAKTPFPISNKPSLFYHLAILPSFSDNLLPHLTVSHHYGTFSVSSPPVHGIVRTTNSTSFFLTRYGLLDILLYFFNRSWYMIRIRILSV